ncbi:MAG: preprotein translocase subunit SecE [Eubacterium sp.]|nr:preprotein translocase subunit SecE [Eubacterium sp.]
MADANKNAVEKEKRSFGKGLKAEWSKIIWPEKKTLLRQVIAVVIISVIVCLLITLADNLGLQIVGLVIKK